LNRFKRDGTTVYVPTLKSHLRRMILPGSGIVGTGQDDGRVLIYYEGNKYGAASLADYGDRVYHAWGRMTWEGRGYPTISWALVDAGELLEVGFLLVPEQPDEIAIGAELRRRGHFGPMSFAIRDSVRRELAKPRVVIDRQDIVDEWVAEARP
jgi:hypothetical protein